MIDPGFGETSYFKGIFRENREHGTISAVMHTFIEQTAKQTKREHKNR